MTEIKAAAIDIQTLQVTQQKNQQDAAAKLQQDQNAADTERQIVQHREGINERLVVTRQPSLQRGVVVVDPRVVAVIIFQMARAVINRFRP